MGAKENFRPLPKKNPAKELSLYQTLGWCYGAQIKLSAVSGAVVVDDPNQQSQPWLQDALDAHKGRLLYILGMRQKFIYLCDCMTDLRYRESAFKGCDRQQSLERIAERIARFQAECDLPKGYDDPSDYFADHACQDLDLQYYELTRPGNHYPIPAGGGGERNGLGQLLGERIEVII
jgi:hypothetical protein